MELCTKGLGGTVNQLKSRGVNLSCVRTCVVVAEERPRISLCDAFTKLFSGEFFEKSFICQSNDLLFVSRIELITKGCIYFVWLSCECCYLSAGTFNK